MDFKYFTIIIMVAALSVLMIGPLINSEEGPNFSRISLLMTRLR